MPSMGPTFPVVLPDDQKQIEGDKVQRTLYQTHRGPKPLDFRVGKTQPPVHKEIGFLKRIITDILG